jgi:hypothetical protein
MPIFAIILLSPWITDYEAWLDPAPQAVAAITLNASTIKAEARSFHLTGFSAPTF